MDNRNFYVNRIHFLSLKNDLKEFFSSQQYMLSKEFANDVLFTHEVKFNNAVENYNDDIQVVEQTILKQTRKLSIQEMRIVNLYHGYRYIFDYDKDINEDTLKVLYHKLSRGLLDEFELAHMGEFYREEPVYIYYSSNLNTEPDQGVSACDLDYFMEQFFAFVDKDFSCDGVDEYIKSQIMHFYFIYVHPYFDINGRTARTTSIWYLLNKMCYPYIIFNRGITYSKQTYYNVIRRCVKRGDVTPFVDYMLKTVLLELQKEYVIHHVNEEIPLSSIEHQTLHYILSLKGLKTVKDFTCFYNHHNEKLKPKAVYQDMILPLIEKEIVQVDRTTSTLIAPGLENIVFSFNDDRFDMDKEKVRLLKF
jgi:hypothetical protein